MKTSIRLLTNGVGVIALAGLLLILTGCGGEGSATGSSTSEPAAPTASVVEPVTAPVPVGTDNAPVNADAGGPVLSFERLYHDFGDVVDTETSETVFRFANTGSSELLITDVKASCGCTVPQLSRTRFAPGEGDTLKVTFDPKGKQGDSTKNIRVSSNSLDEPVITLQLRSNVQPMLRVATRFVRLGDMQVNTELNTQIEAFYTDPDLKFVDVTTTHPDITAHVVETGVVESTGSDITYKATIGINVEKDAPWGTLFATRLALKVNGRPAADREPIDYTYELYLNGSRFGKLVAESNQRGRSTWNSSVLSIGAISPGQAFSESIVIKSRDGEPFSILESKVAESVIPGVKVEVIPQSQSAYEVVISGTAGPARGLAKGRIELRSDVEGEEILQVNFTGSVR